MVWWWGIKQRCDTPVVQGKQMSRCPSGGKKKLHNWAPDKIQHGYWWVLKVRDTMSLSLVKLIVMYVQQLNWMWLKLHFWKCQTTSLSLFKLCWRCWEENKPSGCIAMVVNCIEYFELVQYLKDIMGCNWASFYSVFTPAYPTVHTLMSCERIQLPVQIHWP